MPKIAELFDQMDVNERAVIMAALQFARAHRETFVRETNESVVPLWTLNAVMRQLGMFR